MGGRGQKSPGGNRAGKTEAPQTLEELFDVDSSGQYTEKTYGYQASKDFIDTVTAGGDYGVDRVARQIESVNDVLKMFGVTRDEIGLVLKTLDAEGTNSYAFQDTMGERIVASDWRFADEAGLIDSYTHDVEVGWHPAGTTVDDILSHEVGHAIAALIGRAKSNQVWTDTGDFSKAWDYQYMFKNDKEIVSEACKNVKKTDYGRGKKNMELRLALSEYAAKQDKPYEAVAEAVADYRRNGENANPLSIEIVSLMKRDLNEMRQGGFIY